MANIYAMKLWVRELLRPDIIQINSYLDDGEGQCCLGVLCNLAVREGVEMEIIERERGEIDPCRTIIEYNDEYETLPGAVQVWADVGADPMLNWEDHEDREYHATALNDTKKLNFTQIAKAINDTYKLGMNDEIEAAIDA